MPVFPVSVAAARPTLARRYVALAGLVAFALLLTGCSELRYYRQSAGGQMDIVHRRQAIDTLIADESRDARLRARLEKVREIRAFAVDGLGLPDTDSYTQYADLGRDYAVLALYAAPEFSTDLKTWCYPVVGCAAYRGYFDRAMLTSYADELKRQNYDIYVAEVPAYSTLGWFDDPLLNTVLDWSEPAVAGLIFHELAHQQLYVKGDTVFNESFATAVERAGVERWLQLQGNQAQIAGYRRYWRHREQVVALIAAARNDLRELYRQDSGEQERRLAKQQRLQLLRQQYRDLRRTLASDPGYDDWFAGDINNARLGSVAAYHTYVEVFLTLLAKQHGDLPAFYAEAARMADMPPDQRQQYLAGLL
jgi:predicted aminopeptidase